MRAVSVLVTPSARLVAAAAAEVARQLGDLPRREIAARSIEERGALVVAQGMAEAVRLADEFAPEHLALHARNAPALVPRISRAGAVFVGTSTPEAVGDYLAGPSHVLPTAGTARFASPLSVATFRRRMSVLELTPRGARRGRAGGRGAGRGRGAHGALARGRGSRRRPCRSGEAPASGRGRGGLGRRAEGGRAR